MGELTSLVWVFVTVGALMLSAMVHEVAHGAVAYLCGDDTAKRAGRLSLNPARHLDPFGSVVLPLMMALMGGAVFAFAKPVPYNPWRLKSRRRDEVLVALAGPASNLVLAVVAGLFFQGLWAAVESLPPAQLAAVASESGAAGLLLDMCSRLLATLVRVNLMLAFFNLIPFPPLDGSKLVCPFLKGRALERYYEWQHYAMGVLIVVLYLLPRLGIDPVGAYLSATVTPIYLALLGV